MTPSTNIRDAIIKYVKSTSVSRQRNNTDCEESINIDKDCVKRENDLLLNLEQAFKTLLFLFWRTIY